MASLTQIGRVIIPSPDQDASIAFYTEKLGFSVAADVAYGEGYRWVELAPPGGGANIALGPPIRSRVRGSRRALALAVRRSACFGRQPPTARA
jgi:lactoylglutathione lyase